MGKNKRKFMPKITWKIIYAKLEGGNNIPDKKIFEDWLKGKINNSLNGKLNRIKKDQKDKKGKIKYKIIKKYPSLKQELK